MYNHSGIEFLLLTIVGIIVLGLVLGLAVGVGEIVTLFWQETILDETIEVKVIDMTMEKSSSGINVSYYILVKGVMSDGEVYCDEHYIPRENYADISVGDTMYVHVEKKTKPIFGESMTSELILPVVE